MGERDDLPTGGELAELMAYEPPHDPPPPALPVRKRFYLTKCPHCGWVGSSEQCGTEIGDDSDVWCPVCHSPGCEADPSLTESEEHGEEVYQRLTSAEAALATATAEAARLRAEVEALKARDKEVRVEAAGLAAVLCYVSTYDNPKALRDLCHRTGSFLEKHVVGSEPLARAATAREGRSDGAWPSGCIKPNACSRHRTCVYAMSAEKCRHFGQDLTAAIVQAEAPSTSAKDA